MNIFFLDRDPNRAAQAHFDKHVVKMCIEYAQLLSTAHHVLGTNLSTSALYKSCYVSHPCAIWVRKSPRNYEWLLELFEATLNEYTFRYGKTHATDRLYNSLQTLPKFPDMAAPWSDPPQCMPDIHQQLCTVSAYRDYYRRGKSSHLHRWRNRKAPQWF